MSRKEPGHNGPPPEGVVPPAPPPPPPRLTPHEPGLYGEVIKLPIEYTCRCSACGAVMTGHTMPGHKKMPRCAECLLKSVMGTSVYDEYGRELGPPCPMCDEYGSTAFHSERDAIERIPKPGDKDFGSDWKTFKPGPTTHHWACVHCGNHGTWKSKEDLEEPTSTDVEHCREFEQTEKPFEERLDALEAAVQDMLRIADAAATYKMEQLEHEEEKHDG